MDDPKSTKTDDDAEVTTAIEFAAAIDHNNAPGLTQESLKLRRKLDSTLLPMLCITYALQAIDRTTLSYSAVFGIRQDIHLSSVDISWAGAILYLGYLAWEFPTNILLQKLPIHRFMSATVVAWGIILMCHAAVHDFAGLAAARTFLGALEASVNPGVMLLFTMYYTRSEQPLRMGLWIGSAGAGYVVAGIATFGLGHIQGSIAPWRILFLFWGALTVAWGVFLAIFLPGSPVTTTFLTEEQRVVAIDRVMRNATGVESKKFKWHQFREAMLDPKTWLLFAFAVVNNAPNGGLTTFQGLIIQGMGFSQLQVTLHQMPSGAVQFVFCPLVCYCATRFRDARLLVMGLSLLPFLAGTLGLWLAPADNPYGRLACLWISFAYTAAWTLCMSVATANTAGHTKKVCTNAVIIIGYCLGNFAGPFFFKTSESPRYTLGVGMMLVCVALQIFLLISIAVLFWFRNRTRGFNKKENKEMTLEHEQQGYQMGLADYTDFENKYFKYVF